MAGRDRITAAARRAEALRMRANGRQFDEIGQALGVTTQAAFGLITRALKDTQREPADQVRTVNLLQLDQLQVEALAVLRRTHYVVQGGKIVKDDDGQPLLDDGPVLAAIRVLLAVQERRARLLGLDAPARAEVLTLDAVDAEIRRLEAEVGQAQPPPEPVTPPAPEPVTPPADDFFDHLGDALEVALEALQVPEDQWEVAALAVEKHLRGRGVWLRGEEAGR